MGARRKLSRLYRAYTETAALDRAQKLTSSR
jgi:hypothetical protein